MVSKLSLKLLMTGKMRSFSRLPWRPKVVLASLKSKLMPAW